MRHDCVKIGQPPWLPQRIVGPEPIGLDAAAHGQVAPRSRPRGSKSQGAGHRRAATRQLPAGPVLESVRPEMVDDTPRDLTSRAATSRSDEESWDFDGIEQDFGEEKNPPKPHATHETSPVSGASVVGMTSGVCQGRCCLPAGVPGVSTVLGKEDRI
jgi:hypothetical protein